MWAPHDTPEPVGKIRKPQWSAENTAKRQAVVDRLVKIIVLLRYQGTGESMLVANLTAAVRRFEELDPEIAVLRTWDGIVEERSR